MAWISGSVVLLLMSLGVSSAEEKGTFEIHNKRTPITAASGSLVKLSCDTFYDSKLCHKVHVVWQKEEGSQLTDPKKYFTTVNETLSDGNVRRRQVVTEILNLTPEDSGRYQCYAKCGNEEIGDAMGRFINVTVRD